MYSGFTLVELIIIVAIISVLASIAFLMMSSETAQARDSKRMSDIQMLQNTIAATNGKNKNIAFEKDLENVSRNPDQDSYQTNAGYLFPIRGAYFIPLMDGVFDNTILPKVPLDPKGAYYMGAFLSPLNYQLFAALENVDSKIPTAYVQGSFQEGAILDKASSDVEMDAQNIQVSNPHYFVAGDIIKVEGEYMVVTGMNESSKRIYVYRNSNLPDGSGTGNAVKVHNKGAYIKLYKAAPRANALVCKNAVNNARVGTSALTLASDDSGVIDEALGEIAVDAIEATSWGKVCNDENDAIAHASRSVPYLVTN